MIYQVADIARILADANAEGQAWEYFARQIRNWAQHDFLPAVGVHGRGRTAARCFHEDAIYCAQLLTFLTSMGMRPRQMAPVVDTLTNWLDGDPPVERIKRGEDAFLVITIAPNGHVNVSDIKPEAGVDGAALQPGALVLDLGHLFEAVRDVMGKDSYGRSDDAG